MLLTSNSPELHHLDKQIHTYHDNQLFRKKECKVSRVHELTLGSQTLAVSWQVVACLSLCPEVASCQNDHLDQIIQPIT